jgi:hypothetical protein
MLHVTVWVRSSSRTPRAARVAVIPNVSSQVSPYQVGRFNENGRSKNLHCSCRIVRTGANLGVRRYPTCVCPTAGTGNSITEGGCSRVNTHGYRYEG